MMNGGDSCNAATKLIGGLSISSLPHILVVSGIKLPVNAHF